MSKIFNDDTYTPLPETINLQNEILSNPNYTIILTSVNWPKGYKHVRLFNNLNELLNKLRQNKIHEYNNSTPIDIAQGYYDAECEYSMIDTINQCNYIAFCTKPGTPSSYARDWWFCFVNRIQWLSTNSCRLYYTIDLFQSLYYTVSFNPCYVVREHIYKSSDSDTYANISIESFELGEYVHKEDMHINWGRNDYNTLTRDYANIDLHFTPNFSSSNKKNRFLYPSGTAFVLVTSLGHSDIPGSTEPNHWKEIIDLLKTKYDPTTQITTSINNTKIDPYSDIKIAPQTNIGIPLNLEYWFCITPGVLNSLVETINELGFGSALVSAYLAYYKQTFVKISQPTSFKYLNNNNTYVPKNKILYGYPYNYVRVDCHNGQEILMQYEYGTYDNTGNRILFIGATPYNIPSMGMFISPDSYKNTSIAYDEGVLVTNFPTFSLDNDVYKAWLAQQTPIINANQTILNRNNTTSVKWGLSKFLNNAYNNASNATLGIGTSLLNENPIGALNSLSNFSNNTVNNAMNFGQLIDNVENSQSNMYDAVNAQIESHSLIPPTAISQSIGNFNNLEMGLTGFDIYKMQITAEKAEQIDSYYEQMGYKINRIKVPSFKSRKYWNYVQTIGCNVNTSYSLGANKFSLLQDFNSIFDNGVTLWHTDNIGNYNLNNE